jgi:hypothetical protein
MAMPIQRVKSYLLLGAIFTISALVLVKGCELFPESSFELPSTSRLPKWVTLPSGLTRADVSLTMNYYSMPWGPDAQFILRDKNGKTVKKYNGKMRCGVPFEPENPPQGSPSGYPAYEAISVHGVTEIIEHKRMEPIFYVTDDPAVWKRYESIRC